MNALAGDPFNDCAGLRDAVAVWLPTVAKIDSILADPAVTAAVPASMADGLRAEISEVLAGMLQATKHLPQQTLGRLGGVPVFQARRSEPEQVAVPRSAASPDAESWLPDGETPTMRGEPVAAERDQRPATLIPNSRGTAGRAFRQGPVGYSRVGLRRLVDQAIAGVRTSAVQPAGADDLNRCVALLRAVHQALYPGRAPIAGPATTTDDLAITSPRAEDLIAPGGQWRRVTAWHELEGAVRGAGPGATALILHRYRSDIGHAFALHHTTDADQPLQWIEPANPARRRLSTRLEPAAFPGTGDPLPAPADTYAIVVDSRGSTVSAMRPVPASPPLRWVESASLAHALIDPPASRRYGKTGAEFEIHIGFVRGHPGVNLDQRYNIAHNEALGIRVVLDSAPFLVTADDVADLDFPLEDGEEMQQHILELVVSQPLAALPGEVDNPNADRAAVYEHIRQLVSDMSAIGHSYAGLPLDQRQIELGDILREADGYRLHPQAHSLTFVPVTGARTSNIAPQFSTGVPLSALFDFLTDIAARVPSGSHPTLSGVFAREHLDASVDFAHIVTGHLAERAGDHWALMTDQAIMALRGFLALTYTQVAALATGATQPELVVKNQTAVLARNHLNGIRAELPPPVRDMLHAHADDIAAMLEAQILETIPNYLQLYQQRNGLPLRPLQARLFVEALQVTVPLAEYLDSALRNDASEIRQNAAFGGMLALPDLDRTSRPGQPMVVLEVRFFGRAPDDWRPLVPFSEAEEYANDIDRLVNAAVHQADAAIQVSADDSLFQAIAQSARWGRVSELSHSTAAELRRYVEESTVAPSDYLLESIAALTPGYLLARGLPDPVVSDGRPAQPHDANVALARHQLAQQINAGDLQLLTSLRQMLRQRNTRPGIIRLVELIIQKVHSDGAVPSVLELLAAAVREPVLRATPPGWYVPVVAADALNLNLTILQPGQPPWQLRPGLPPLYLEYDGNQYSPAGPPQHGASVTAAQPPAGSHIAHDASTGAGIAVPPTPSHPWNTQPVTAQPDHRSAQPHLPPPPPEQDLLAAWLATSDWTASHQFFLDNHAALHTAQSRQVLHQMVATGAYGSGAIHEGLLDERMRGHGAIGYLYLTALRQDRALDQLTPEIAAQPDLAEPLAALIDVAGGEPERQGHATVLRAVGLAFQGDPDLAAQLISTVHTQISTRSRLEWIDRLARVAANAGDTVSIRPLLEVLVNCPQTAPNQA